MESKTGPDSAGLPENPNRRTFIKKSTTALGISAICSYLSFAPENWYFSLKDPSGLRSLPKKEFFILPDYSVQKPINAASIGVSRSKAVKERLVKSLDAIGGLKHYIKPNDIVFIKPNVAFDRSPELGATTNPIILGELIKLLFEEAKVKEVRVGDNPIESPADCFLKSGIKKAVEQNGGRVVLPDSNSFRILSTPKAELIKEWSFFARPFKNVNKVIGLAPVKDHNLSQASMGLKNWYGLLGGPRNQFHQDIHTIISDLAIMIKPTLSILDGSRILMRNGPTGGDPTFVETSNIIVSGTDPVAMDTWAFLNLLKRKEQQLPLYLSKAQQKGAGKMDFNGHLKEVV